MSKKTKRIQNSDLRSLRFNILVQPLRSSPPCASWGCIHAAVPYIPLWHEAASFLCEEGDGGGGLHHVPWS